jgi:hypothetical protein
MWPPREPHGIAAFGTTMPALATAKTWLAGIGADNREDRTAGPDRTLLVTHTQRPSRRGTVLLSSRQFEVAGDVGALPWIGQKLSTRFRR